MAVNLNELEQINTLVAEGVRLGALASAAELVSSLKLTLGPNTIDFPQNGEVHNAIRALLKSRVEANKQQLRNLGVEA